MYPGQTHLNLFEIVSLQQWGVKNTVLLFFPPPPTPTSGGHSQPCNALLIFILKWGINCDFSRGED